VKILRAEDKYVFQLFRREKQLLIALLKLYPCITSVQQLSQSAALPEASQRLLEEALSEQRAENKRQVQALLKDPNRLQPTDTGCRLKLSPGELEWLLQILNDIRVGSWVQLGSPEQKMELALLNDKTAPHLWAMEMAGYFQMELLAAIRR